MLFILQLEVLGQKKELEPSALMHRFFPNQQIALQKCKNQVNKYEWSLVL